MDISTSGSNLAVKYSNGFQTLASRRKKFCAFQIDFLKTGLVLQM